MAAVTGSIEERRFVVMRFDRIKTWSHVYHVRRHNMREMDCPHTEKDAPAPELIVGTADVADAIRKLLKRYQVVPKSGEVLALEFIVSTSREVFEGLEDEAHAELLDEFVTSSRLAFDERFRIPGQIVSIALHRDERTPHLHVVVVPLICAPDKRRKGDNLEIRLSAKRVVGGRGDMSREQTRFASYFEDMGLERGKERSGARHISNREHEAMLEAEVQAAQDERAALAVERENVAKEAAQIGNERDALAVERVEIEAERRANAEDRAQIDREKAALEADRLRVREDEDRLAADRAAVAKQSEEAEALKKRAIRRTARLRDLLVAGEQLRSYVLGLSAERQTPELRKAHEATRQFAAKVSQATQDDAWLAAAVAFRDAQSAGMAR